MAYQDFREFLAALEKEGQLLTVNEEVKPEPDLGAAARAASNLGDKTLRFCLTIFTDITMRRWL